MRLLPNLSRNEHGSEFHLPDLQSISSIETGLSGSIRVGTGRDALALLLTHGAQHRGWRRIFIPTYYCEDVMTRLYETGVEIARYPAGPEGIEDMPRAKPGDVLLRVAYFGWGLAPLPEEFNGEIIEDHTHDPWGSAHSAAHFCFASLRKTLPLPDGGVLWSPRGYSLPSKPQLDQNHANAALKKLAAMSLKRVYLSGGNVPKEAFRALSMEGERAFGVGQISAMLPWSEIVQEAMPVLEWRDRRRYNLQAFREAIGHTPGLEILGPPYAEGPFAAILRVGNKAVRDALRAALLRDAIYPAVLWPIDPERLPLLPSTQIQFAETTMALHVDARYDEKDMIRVAERVKVHAERIVS